MDRHRSHPQWAHQPPAAQQFGQRHNAPPGLNLPFREFSRFDYSHDRQPRVIPHVREYEHGRRGFNGVPVFNHSDSPPSVVRNSAANNPLLFENFHQRDPSFNQDSFQSHVQNTIDMAPPPQSRERPIPDNTYSDLFTMYKSLESRLKVFEEENIRLKTGVSVSQGGAEPSMENVYPGEHDRVEQSVEGK